MDADTVLGVMETVGEVNQCREIIKHWKKEQASGCCTDDVCLRQSVNQLYNNQQTCSFCLETIKS